MLGKGEWMSKTIFVAAVIAALCGSASAAASAARLPSPPRKTAPAAVSFLKPKFKPAPSGARRMMQVIWGDAPVKNALQRK